MWHLHKPNSSQKQINSRNFCDFWNSFIIFECVFGELENGIRCNKINLIHFILFSFLSPIAVVADAVFIHCAETKSILTDGDWKKLWMEAGNSNANLKKDNTIDSSDSPIFDDTEVSDINFRKKHLTYGTPNL